MADYVIIGIKKIKYTMMNIIYTANKYGERYISKTHNAKDIADIFEFGSAHMALSKALAPIRNVFDQS